MMQRTPTCTLLAVAGAIRGLLRHFVPGWPALAAAAGAPWAQPWWLAISHLSNMFPCLLQHQRHVVNGCHLTNLNMMGQQR